MGMNRVRGAGLAVALVALVVLAGCQAPIIPTGGQQTSQSPGETGTDQSADNPWNAETITVAVDAELQDRNYTALARPAIEYWNQHRKSEAKADYGTPPRLELTSNADEADVVIHYQPTIPKCGGQSAPREAGFYHCTPTIDANTTVDGQLELLVTSQFRNQSTTDITINALGGLYGIEAANEPRPVESPELLDPFPRTDTVTVGITYITSGDRNITPLVQEAVEYWMENDDKYGDYTTDWVVKPNADNPDVVVLYVDTIVKCGFGPNQDYYIGCTNLLSTDQSANTPVQVEIAAGYNNESTINTIKHEFGHLYGLEHGEEPMPLMSATGDAVPLNETEENSTDGSG